MSKKFVTKIYVLILVTAMFGTTKAAESTTLTPIGEQTFGMPTLLYTGTFKVPIRARKLDTCGWVDLEFDVSSKGKIKQPKVISSSHSYFEKSALRGIRRAYYKPAVDDLGRKTHFNSMRARVSYFLREGCDEVFPDEGSNYVATHCLIIDFIAENARSNRVDYYVKNTCSYPVLAAACISGSNKGRGFCKYDLTLKPKTRRWLEIGFTVTQRTKVSKQAFACKLDTQKNVQMVGLKFSEFKRTLSASCRASS